MVVIYCEMQTPPAQTQREKQVETMSFRTVLKEYTIKSQAATRRVRTIMQLP